MTAVSATATATSRQAPSDFAAVQALVAEDARQVDALIRRRLASEVLLVNQVAEHIVAGGKRLRPLVVLLAARAAGYRGDGHIAAAAIIEFIHTATLLHDDVVDESDLRRGRRTANSLFGNAASVLVGDFLYSRSFQLMVDLDAMPVMRLLADTTNAIAEGEVLQLMHIHNPDTTEADYLRVIERKTAILFAAAAQLGGLLAGLDGARVQALRDYGHALGMAFQIADDILDYEADEDALGKHLGDDLAEGKPTLPLIHALAHARGEEAATLRNAVASGGREHLPAVLAAIRSHGGLDYARRQAGDHAGGATDALAALPASPYRDALAFLARFAVDRGA
ncbi:MAG: polyprenyl synthetase family protein [Xanthomonadales bacterium]|nr:polyprenyl synthetase family protein [Xanthomonadales bacterium]